MRRVARTRMSRSAGRRMLAAGALALLTTLLAASGAMAAFTAPLLLSGTPQLQFENASAPALSADGRYAVFQGALADIRGVYRRNLQTAEVEQVAGGDASDPEEPCNTEDDPLAACDAAAPSVSADGRYVAFTTTADLEPLKDGRGEPSADQGCPEVYVRDMDKQPGEPGAYTLASALDGSETGIVFVGPCSPSQLHLVMAGAQAAPGVAISADGRHVVFTVLSVSNLARGPDCPEATPLAECAPETPQSQVAVRNLETNATTLVSATPEGQPTPGGGAYPSGDSESTVYGADPASSEYGDQPTGSSAAISADASTVAWLGTNVPDQVPSATEIGAEHPGLGNLPPGFEVEPLWRRVADGSSAVTERLLAAAGLDFYFSPAAEVTFAVVDGSLLGMQSSVYFPPVLSADGRTVGMIANAPLPSSEGSWTLANISELPTDAYVARVPEDPASPPQVTALTATPDFAAGLAAIWPVKDIAISPDGSRVAFDTGRSQFALPALAFTSQPFANLSHVAETFEADLTRGTLERVSSTYSGSEPNGAAGLLAFSGDGQELAFASGATNLFFGDGVPASEVYLVDETPPASSAAPQVLRAAPNAPPPSPEWTLDATATAQADGGVIVQASVPGAGTLVASAAAQLSAAALRSASYARPRRRAASRPPRRHGSGAATRGARSSRVRGSRARGRTHRPRRRGGGGVSIPPRTVARAAVAAGDASVLTLRLSVLPRYRALLTHGPGLYALVRVSFTAAGHAQLAQEIPVTFRLVPAPGKPRVAASAKAGACAGDGPLCATVLPGGFR
jgi:hypothetical protein